MFGHGCLRYVTVQVVGPSVRTFGMCVDANATVVCEPLTSAMDMLLIPHLPDAFAALASLFEAMPQLVRAWSCLMCATECLLWQG